MIMNRFAPLHDTREYDAVVASGEQVTAGLLAIVLEGMGVNARSWQGWQLPILTSNVHGSARIEDINGDELVKRFKELKQVAISSDHALSVDHDLAGAAGARRQQLQQR